MTTSASIAGIYDFEIFPYALGDVLTWNVRTAMRCEDLGRERVDAYICVDGQYPAGIYQRGLVNPDNFELFFSELFDAFGTHPSLGNIHIFRRREALLERLQALIEEDDINEEAFRDYLGVLGHRATESTVNKVRRAISGTFRGKKFIRAAFNRSLPSSVKDKVRNVCLPSEEAINSYFIKYIHSHESINEFAARRGKIPLLQPALGCSPDVDELMRRRFAGKRVVPFHLRLRRVDVGYGGEHSYDRDSDFLEWYDFLRQAGTRHPEVEFVALGRLQEKPLELLQLPNVTSLRTFGMGLGHELTLMLRSDLFIGTSSGFAALANFSSIPYFITHMNPGSCRAYAIPEGAERLPFALENQKLIYERETSELLMSLLETGLGLSGGAPKQRREDEETCASQEIDVRKWLNTRSQAMNPAATTRRFDTGGTYRREETAYLLLPNLERARQALVENRREEAKEVLRRLQDNFPDICAHLPEYQLLDQVVAAERMDPVLLRHCLSLLDIRAGDFVGKACPASAVGEAGWRPENWLINSGVAMLLDKEPQPAMTIRQAGINCYWHSERFMCSDAGGKIIVRLEAKNSLAPSRHRVYIFEDGKFRVVGELVTGIDWQRYEIPIDTHPGSILEFQLDQSDDFQWLSFRDLHVIHGRSLLMDRAGKPLLRRGPVAIPMARWEGKAGAPCEGPDGGPDCRQWPVAGKGYVRTPVLPQPGDAGLLIHFEVRTDKPAFSVTRIHLFEDESYQTVAQHAFGPEWRRFSLVLQPNRDAVVRIQIDYPAEVGSLSIRNFLVEPLDRDHTA